MCQRERSLNLDESIKYYIRIIKMCLKSTILYNKDSLELSRRRKVSVNISIAARFTRFQRDFYFEGLSLRAEKGNQK